MKALSKLVMTALMLGTLVSATVSAQQQSNWWEGQWKVQPPNHGPVTWTINANGTASESGGGFVQGSGRYTVHGSAFTILFQYADFSTGTKHDARYVFSMYDNRQSGVGTFYIENREQGNATIAK